MTVRPLWTVLLVGGPVALGLSGSLMLARSGGYVYVRTSSALLVAEAGVAIALGVVAVFVVRARRVRLRAAAAAAMVAAVATERAEHRRFLRRLDHELKNPLTAIRVGLANLAATHAAAVAPIDGQAVRLSRLVADLRKLAEVADRPLAGVPLDVGALLRDVAAGAADLPGGDGRRITVSVPQVPWPLPAVTGDRDLLELALGNLVANAVKYSAAGATVELRGFEANGAVVVEVADSGLGIPADEIPHVWEELVRGRAARTADGSGLGLSLVRVIVARHGGGWELRSRPGAGTVVRIWLPATPG